MTDSQLLAHLKNVFAVSEQLHVALEQADMFNLICRMLTAASDPVSFIQVGANDGKTGDPLYPFVQTGKWHGLMIEPHPTAFAKLHGLYGSAEHITLVNMAITPEQGTVTLFAPKDEHSSKSTLAPKTGFAARSEGGSDEISVEGVRLSQLVSDHSIDRLDLLQIDAEGFDFEILKTFDFSSCQPLVVQYEDRHLFPPKERRRAVEFLRDLGYQVCQGLPPRDTVALQVEALAERLGHQA